MKMKQEAFFQKIDIAREGREALKSWLRSGSENGPTELLSRLSDEINHNYRAVVVDLNGPDDFFSYEEIHQINPMIGRSLGKLLVQNEQGDKVISVYDRDRLNSMWKGARYHQTREGGSIHTDNVNVPEIWDLLYLSCISPALVGGENILVDGIKIHQALKESFPRALNVLEESFFWEMRGVSDSLYQAPIITYNKSGQPLFRHLRPYMESAHEKAQVPLSPDQLYAIDVLDALTGSSEFQLRYRMKKGDVLITRDAQVLHGRCSFSDDLEAVSFDQFIEGKGQKMKRTMERLWIEK